MKLQEIVRGERMLYYPLYLQYLVRSVRDRLLSNLAKCHLSEYYERVDRDRTLLYLQHDNIVTLYHFQVHRPLF